MVSAANAGNLPLAAIADQFVGNGEKITLVNNADGTISLKAVANGQYVCAVIDENNQLLARSTSINEWEKFVVVKIASASSNQYALQSVANGKFVKADLNDGGILKADSNAVGGAWEAFVFDQMN